MEEDKDESGYFVMLWHGKLNNATVESMSWFHSDAYERWPDDCVGRNLSEEEAIAIAALFNNQHSKQPLEK